VSRVSHNPTPRRERCRAQPGFSLTELLVVVAIMLILLALLVVGVEALHTYAGRLECKHRMEQISYACQMYASANHGLLPGAWNYDTGRPWYHTLVSARYLTDEESTECPSAELASSYGTAQTGPSTSIPTDVNDSLLAALRWMKNNQASDGSWGHIDGGSVQDYSGPTALGLLAFLSYGCTTSHPPEFADTVKKALVYLMNKMDANGCLTTHSYRDYHQGCGSMALSDALAMMGDVQLDGANRSLRDAAQRAFDYIISRQDDYPTTYGFGYVSTRNDMSASSWPYQAIASAQHAGLNPTGNTWSEIDARAATFFKLSICVNRAQCDQGHRFYRSELQNGKCPVCGSGNISTIPDDYHTCYRFDTGGGPHGTTSRDRMTASNCCCRLLLGHEATQDHSPRRYTRGENTYNQLEWLRENGRHINYATRTSTSNYDLYFIYYTTLAFYAAGGAYWDEWVNGNGTTFDGFREPLIALQHPDGYWDGPHAFCMYNHYGGRVYPTSLACIGLEASVGDYLYGTKWSTAGAHSYGYNKLVGEGLGTPAADTIILMDYMRSGIDGSDPAEYIAPRHGGRVNLLLGDGRVEARRPEQITEEREGELRIKHGLLTLTPGD
jgi:prepilin-type N-terminal cleavage/methylation domain-containing protein/prepilin-type processing-associated H-X9-DG protein